MADHQEPGHREVAELRPGSATCQVHERHRSQQEGALAAREDQQRAHDAQREGLLAFPADEAERTQEHEERCLEPVDRVGVGRGGDQRGAQPGGARPRLVAAKEHEQGHERGGGEEGGLQPHRGRDRRAQTAGEQREVGVERRREGVEELARVVDEPVSVQGVAQVAVVDERVVELVGTVAHREPREEPEERKQGEREGAIRRTEGLGPAHPARIPVASGRATGCRETRRFGESDRRYGLCDPVA